MEDVFNKCEILFISVLKKLCLKGVKPLKPFFTLPV